MRKVKTALLTIVYIFLAIVYTVMEVIRFATNRIMYLMEKAAEKIRGAMIIAEVDDIFKKKSQKRAERIIMESLKRTRSLSKNQPKEES